MVAEFNLRKTEEGVLINHFYSGNKSVLGQTLTGILWIDGHFLWLWQTAATLKK